MCHYVSVTSHVVACAWVIHMFSTFSCLSCDHSTAPKKQWHVHVCHMYNVTGVLHDTAVFRNVEKLKYTQVKNRPKSKNSQWEPSEGERMIFIQGGLFTLKGFFNICPCKSTVWEVCPVVIRFVLLQETCVSARRSQRESWEVGVCGLQKSRPLPQVEVGLLWVQ